MVSPSTTGVNDASSTSADVKTLIGDMLQKLLGDNQVREDRITECIDAFAHVSKESSLRMKTELMVDVKEDIQASKGCMNTQIKALKSSIDYLCNNNFIFHHDTTAISIPVLENTIVDALPPSFDFFYDNLS